MNEKGRELGPGEMQEALAGRYACDTRTVQRNLLKAKREAEKRQHLGAANGGKQAKLQRALLPMLQDGFGTIYEEVYVNDGKIIDRGSYFRFSRYGDRDIGWEYLDDGFDGTVRKAEFIELHPLAADTLQTLGEKVIALCLYIEVSNNKLLQEVRAYFPVDYQADPRGFTLLPDRFLGEEAKDSKCKAASD